MIRILPLSVLVPLAVQVVGCAGSGEPAVSAETLPPLNRVSPSSPRRRCYFFCTTSAVPTLVSSHLCIASLLCRWVPTSPVATSPERALCSQLCPAVPSVSSSPLLLLVEEDDRLACLHISPLLLHSSRLLLHSSRLLLRAEEDDFWHGISAVTFRDVPELQEQVTVTGYPIGGDSLSITQGIVSRVTMSSYTPGGAQLMNVQARSLPAAWHLARGHVVRLPDLR